MLTSLFHVIKICIVKLNFSKCNDFAIRVVFFLLILALWQSMQECLAQKSKNSPKYNKILVLAKVQQPDIEKTFENAMVAALKDKGYTAVPSYNTFTGNDIENTARLVAKADSLKIDALLAFTLVNIETKIINTPQVNANIGVPVSFGFFSVYVGTSVPLGGGPIEEKTVHLKAGFYYDRNSTEPSWNMDLSDNLGDGTDALIYNFTRKIVKSLFKQKIL